MGTRSANEHDSRNERELRRQAEGPPVPEADRWNHNIHYHPHLLAVVPDGARRVLDVGCGDGLFTRRLVSHTHTVVGIDVDRDNLVVARRETAEPNVEYVHADVLTHPFRLESFDAVLCIMALHHMDTADGLQRLVELVRPGGAVGVVGIARSRLPDLPYDAAGTVATRVLHRVRTPWAQRCHMVWPPRDTYAEVRRTAAAVLPGSEFRRRVLFRYTVTWVKPDTR